MQAEVIAGFDAQEVVFALVVAFRHLAHDLCYLVYGGRGPKYSGNHIRSDAYALESQVYHDMVRDQSIKDRGNVARRLNLFIDAAILVGSTHP